MRKTILLTLLAVSASAHATNIQYDLSWVLTNQSGLGYLVVVGFAAMLVLGDAMAPSRLTDDALHKFSAKPSLH